MSTLLEQWRTTGCLRLNPTLADLVAAAHQEADPQFSAVVLRALYSAWQCLTKWGSRQELQQFLHLPEPMQERLAVLLTEDGLLYRERRRLVVVQDAPVSSESVLRTELGDLDSPIRINEAHTRLLLYDYLVNLEDESVIQLEERDAPVVFGPESAVAIGRIAGKYINAITGEELVGDYAQYFLRRIASPDGRYCCTYFNEEGEVAAVDDFRVGRCEVVEVATNRVIAEDHQAGVPENIIWSQDGYTVAVGRWIVTTRSPDSYNSYACSENAPYYIDDQGLICGEDLIVRLGEGTRGLVELPNDRLLIWTIREDKRPDYLCMVHLVEKVPTTATLKEILSP